MHFRNYGFGKPSLDNCLKRPISEDSSKSNMGSGPKHYSNLNHSSFSRFIDQCEGNLIGKKSLLVICKIFGLFVNTLTLSHKFSLLNRDKLTQQIQLQLSKK